MSGDATTQGHHQKQGSLWTRIESSMKIKIPETVKNILNAVGYDSEVALEKLEEKDFLAIESFMKKSSHLIPEEKRGKYFGIYKDKPEAFTVVPGHRLVILEISKHLKTTKFKEESCVPAQMEDVSLDEDGNRLQVKLFSWLRLQSVIPSSSVQFEDIKVTEIADGCRMATVACPVPGCGETMALLKPQGKWRTSSFYKHFQQAHTAPNSETASASRPRLFLSSVHQDNAEESETTSAGKPQQSVCKNEDNSSVAAQKDAIESLPFRRRFRSPPPQKHDDVHERNNVDAATSPSGRRFCPSRDKDTHRHGPSRDKDTHRHGGRQWFFQHPKDALGAGIDPEEPELQVVADVSPHVEDGWKAETSTRDRRNDYNCWKPREDRYRSFERRSPLYRDHRRSYPRMPYPGRARASAHDDGKTKCSRHTHF